MKLQTAYPRLSAITLGLVLAAQWGCSQQGATNTALTQPTASPSPTVDPATTMAAVSPTPAPETQMMAPTGGGSTRPAGSAGASGGSTATSPSRVNPAPSEPRPAAPPVERPAPPRTHTIAAGTPITVTTSRDLSTKTAKAGDRFTASLNTAITDGDWVIARRGAPVEGVVVESDSGGRIKGKASLTVELKSLTLADGRTVALSTSNFTKEAKSSVKKDAIKTGVGAGIGAAIGAIAGGGKGAAIGAGAGGAAGGGYVLATKGDPAVISSESSVTFRLNDSVTVTKR
jgi:hypothetical protein